MVHLWDVAKNSQAEWNGKLWKIWKIERFSLISSSLIMQHLLLNPIDHFWVALPLCQNESSRETIHMQMFNNNKGLKHSKQQTCLVTMV